jgi:hypothetical protein
VPWRIWSTDWFRAPRQEAEKLLGFLDDTRKTWKPEHSSGASWVEEGAAATERGPATSVKAPASDRQLVMDVLLRTEDDIEVEVGDLVRYADVAKPADILTVRITHKPSDLTNGFISEATPLAQALLGAVVGDEVPLYIPSAPQRRFRIIGITRSGLSAAAQQQVIRRFI